jgi:hypothetical protein
MREPKRLETPASIWQWMRETFGHEGQTDRYQVSRAIVELEEALDALDVSEENTHQVAKEVTDCIIVCMGILGKRGYDMDKLVHEKMLVNRQRSWEYVNGRWQHVTLR